MIRETKNYTTSDGTIFVSRLDAEQYEARWEFRNWCRDNICRGGEWDSDMVCTAIWGAFHVAKKPSQGGT